MLTTARIMIEKYWKQINLSSVEKWQRKRCNTMFMNKLACYAIKRG